MSIERTTKEILEIKNILDKSRVGLRKEVFIERHLESIALNGKPTYEQQVELVKLAGGENKRINIVDENNNILITLPSALSSGNTLSKESSKLARDLSDGDNKTMDESRKKRINNAVDEISKNKLNELSTDWEFVIEYFKDEIPNTKKEVTAKKEEPKKKAISFDYD